MFTNIFLYKLNFMSKINGIYAASISILDQNLKLDVNKTIRHSENLIKSGCHGTVFWEHRTVSTNLIR